MQARRVLVRHVVPALFAAAGAWGFYLLLFQWFLGLVAPGMIGGDVPFAVAAAFALLACVGLAVFLPLLRRWQTSAPVAIGLAAILGLSGWVASAGTAIAGGVVVCPDLCSPGKTWSMLPTMLVAALLAAIGPMFYAVARTPRDLGGFPDTRGQVFWGLAVIFGVLGFAFAMGWWVEMWLYPG